MNPYGSIERVVCRICGRWVREWVTVESEEGESPYICTGRLGCFDAGRVVCEEPECGEVAVGTIDGPKFSKPVCQAHANDRHYRRRQKR